MLGLVCAYPITVLIRRHLFERARWSESDYNAACAIAAHLLDEPHIKAAHSLICSALSRVPVINERQLPELLGPHLDRFDIEPATAGEE